jgi:hypothetical protein
VMLPRRTIRNCVQSIAQARGGLCSRLHGDGAKADLRKPQRCDLPCASTVGKKVDSLPTPRAFYSRAMATYRIKQIGSLGTGWAIERDGVITRSGPSAAVLGAYLDVIEMRPPPTCEERLVVFSPAGRPAPSRDPFRKA